MKGERILLTTTDFLFFQHLVFQFIKLSNLALIAGLLEPFLQAKKTPPHMQTSTALFYRNSEMKILLSFSFLFLSLMFFGFYQLSAQGGCATQEIGKLLSNDIAASDFFGISVSLDSNRAAIGAYLDDDDGNNSGAVYIFEDSSGTWIQTAKVKPLDGSANKRFGRSVSLAGNQLLVGADGDDVNGTFSGSAYLFTAISANAWQQTAKLNPTSSNGAASDVFGTSVHLDGARAIVGAPGDSSGAGAVYIYTLGTTQSVKLKASDRNAGAKFGQSVSRSGGRLAVGANNDNNPNGTGAGAVYIYDLVAVAGNWIEDTKIIASGVGEPERFGEDVSIDGNRLLIGAGASQGGAAYIYEDSSGTWVEKKKMFLSSPGSGENYGRAVSLDGDLALVGASGITINGIKSGAVYAYSYSGGNWDLLDELVPSDPGAGDSFGWDVSLDGSTAIISAFAKGPFSQGAAYAYFVGGDQDPPVFNGGPASTISVNNDAGACNAIVTWTAPTAVDSCDGAIVPTSTANSGDAFPVGTTTVTYTATDSSGNIGQFSFDIEVTDAEDPVITGCPDSIVVAASGDTMITWTAPTPSDNCGISSFTQTAGPASGSTFSFGVDTITYKATDEAGNTVECSFIVEVNNLTSIENLPGHLINIHPNPFQDLLEIDWTGFPYLVEEMKLITIDGKVLLQKTVSPTSGDVVQISTSDLPSGLYLLEIRSSQGRVIKRVSRMD